MTGLRRGIVTLIANALLAAAVQSLAPAQPGLSDREEYEWVGRHALEPDCPYSVYCYRILVPAVLESIPIEPDARWRWFRWSATAVAGSIVAGTTAALGPGMSGAVLATIVVQGSFGFAFTAYDPYTADPLVFVMLALITWCWLTNRWGLALLSGVVGVLAKETVALISVASALAALQGRREDCRYWVAQAAIVVTVLFGFHWVADTYLGWDMSTNAASKFEDGSWLMLWWTNNPGVLRKAFFVFKPFGFAWIYAAAGFRYAPPDLRRLAVGALAPFLALNYIQNPERALATTFFVIVPLAVLTLGRVPLAVALIAVITNSAFTVRVGTASEWLPPSGYLLPAAAAAAMWVLWHLRGRQANGLSLGWRKA